MRIDDVETLPRIYPLVRDIVRPEHDVIFRAGNGLHCPADHNPKRVGQLVDLAVQTVTAFGFERGVLHVEGKCTTRGPRIIEVNARMGGGRVSRWCETYGASTS